MNTNFEIWRDSDNVIKTAENSYKTQCTQYAKVFTESELKAYFIKEYCNNNTEEADQIADLFEHYEELPEDVKNLIDLNTEFHSYEDCEEFKKQLQKLGYTCEYGLDNIPHSLVKLETTNETHQEMNTTEKNILIALFMGYIDNGCSEEGFLINPNTNFDEEINDLKFHSDWNWLMEVVDKIENLTDEKSFILYDFIIYPDAVSITDQHSNEIILINKSEGEFETKIQAVYNACLEFIKWYNQQKN